MLNALKTAKDLDNTWVDFIDPTWIRELDATPFLTRCRTGIVSWQELETFLVQQYFYSRHFTRYLCALLSNITKEGDRQELMENLIDESGLGIEKGVPHSILYRRMLERFGINVADRTPFRSTEGLIDTMFESCRNSNPIVGLGALCLGAEAIVPHLYTQIIQGFEAHRISRDALEFFHLHVACDDEHAITMKEIIEKEVNTLEKRMSLRCSAARVLRARTQFFDEIGATAHGKL